MRFFNKVLSLTVISLILLISLKGNSSFKKKFYNVLYNTNINFSFINKNYEKLFGKISPSKKIKMVSNNKLNYSRKEKYKDGVKLYLSKDEPILAKRGIVIFKGSKDNLECLTISREDNINETVCNLKNIKYSMYDYLKEGDILGEANGEYIYVYFEKDGKVIDYKKYI